MIATDVIVHLDFTRTSYQPTPPDHVRVNVTIVTGPQHNLLGILIDTTRTLKCRGQRTNR